MKYRPIKKDSGFTIIEVMIVLAIAALILVVVLVAIPQLQRNQRNNARQSVAARAVAEFGNYAGNNNGQYPEDAAELSGFYTRYLSGVDITDPQTGNDMVLNFNDTPTVDGATDIPTDADVGTFQYAPEYECDGEAINDTGNGRQFAMYTELEGGAIYCLDNS